MISFASDYIAGAHPRILERLLETNLEMLPGYGSDVYTKSAAEKIREAIGCPEAEIFFLTGGTQTNQLVVSTMLNPTEGVISAVTGHVNAHEAGAIEYTGHKVLALPGKDGKLSAETVKKYLETFYGDENHEHMVFPGMVYISWPTEYGTLYSRAELQALSEVTHTYGIPLYVDGARLAYGLMSPDHDVTLRDLASLADVFYIGGTKCGALCGEALVFSKHNMPARFLTQVKQHGALNAKGRLVGVQFDALFTDGLYMEIGRHGIEKAEELKRIFRERGYRLFLESPTNQQFVILENREIAVLAKQVEFSFWEPYDEDHTVVRFATSWSTTDEHLQALAGILDRLNREASSARTPSLVMTEQGLTLQANGQVFLGDFSRMLPRLRQANLQEEMLLKAARIRNADHPLRALDATAGMGEDALILAAGGFQVDLYENDPVIAALLRDAMKRAAGEEILKSVVSRMTLHEEDSIEAMKVLDPVYDVIYLDPMFPAREKSALVKKKFQLIHELEKPCRDEEELLAAAMALRPLKLVIKRPLKGAFLAGRKPDYSLKGKAIRYDCFVFARETLRISPFDPNIIK